MGYTHYMTQKAAFTKAEWHEITRTIRTILDVARGQGIEIADAWGERAILGYEACDMDSIRFNGLEDDSCETFYLTRARPPLEEWQRPEQRGWSFCKTNRRPYDTAVTACLIYLEGVHPDKFSVGSDGTPEDWKPGLALVKKALGMRAAFAQIPAEILADAA